MGSAGVGCSSTSVCRGEEFLSSDRGRRRSVELLTWPLRGGVGGAACLLFFLWHIFTEKDEGYSVLALTLMIVGLGYSFTDWAFVIFSVVFMLMFRRRYGSASPRFAAARLRRCARPPSGPGADVSVATQPRGTFRGSS